MEVSSSNDHSSVNCDREAKGEEKPPSLPVSLVWIQIFSYLAPADIRSMMQLQPALAAHLLLHEAFCEECGDSYELGALTL